MGKVISICSHKGGSGRTTAVASLADVMHRRGCSVLSIDMDPLHNLSTAWWGGPAAEAACTSYTVFDSLTRMHRLIPEGGDGFGFVPSDLRMTGLDLVLSRLKDTDRVTVLAKMLDRWRETCDVILIDCPSSLNTACANALAASDSCIIPVTADIWSLAALEQTVLFIGEMKRYNPSLECGGIFINRWHRHYRSDMDFVEWLSSSPTFGGLLLDTRIRECSWAARPSPGSRGSVPASWPDSTAAKDYEALAGEIAAKLGIKTQNTSASPG